MIEKGDGIMQRRMDAGRCPNCNTATLVVQRVTELHAEYQCGICRLKIKDYKGDGNEAGNHDG
jgi:transcription elongation factor Elf1